MEHENDKSASFAFEHVAAKLVPFDFSDIGGRSITAGSAVNPSPPAATPGESSRGVKKGSVIIDTSATSGVDSSGNTSMKRNHALWPIFMTNGLVFPYNPAISENVQVNYDAVEITHSNESYHFYKNTANVRISLSNCVWTCDTFDNAIYAMSVLHFLRTYSNMDFGRLGTGKPPSPMWFSAYGNYAFNRVPVFLEKADWTFPNDVDYVGIPEPGSEEYEGRKMITNRSPSTGPYTWMPMKFEVSAISLIVQHAPSFWLDWSLSEYRSGAMLRNRGGFHRKQQ